ncbi:MAG TPA: HisA/HisF-related TIM barrel protein, partial [Methanocorpusculum sp.]|nr:HisA/HisF-related TIM barrel protein [Methanocorpusculum sp.]
AGEVLLTSIETDGMNTGYDLEITSKVSESLDVPLIASGGVGTYDHFYDGFVKGKADACLAAGVFHSGKMTVQSVKEYLLSRGVMVRV